MKLQISAFTNKEWGGCKYFRALITVLCNQILLQILLFCYNRKRVIYGRGGHNSSALTQYRPNICRIHCLRTIHSCKCSSEKYRNHYGMDCCNYFREVKKHYSEKKLFPVTKHNLQGNNYFGSQPFLMSYNFIKIFVHL